MDLVYKIVPTELWREAEASGFFTGAPVDHADGFIHFSTSDQLRETARKHFGGQNDLLLVAVDPAKLGDALDDLRYECSRGGALFPHLYVALPLTAVAWTRHLPIGTDGLHVFPEEVP